MAQITSHLKIGAVIYLYDGMTVENLTLLCDSSITDIRLGSGDFSDLSQFAMARKRILALHIKGAGVYDINGIHLLDKLENLTLETAAKFLPTGARLDFSKFPELKECHVYWRKEYSSNLFRCEKLQDLRLFSYDQPSLSEFASAKRLISLSIAESKLENLIHPSFLWVAEAGYKSRPPQWK